MGEDRVPLRAQGQARGPRLPGYGHQGRAHRLRARGRPRRRERRAARRPRRGGARRARPGDAGAGGGGARRGGSLPALPPGAAFGGRRAARGPLVGARREDFRRVHARRRGRPLDRGHSGLGGLALARARRRHRGVLARRRSAPRQRGFRREGARQAGRGPRAAAFAVAGRGTAADGGPAEAPSAPGRVPARGRLRRAGRDRGLARVGTLARGDRTSGVGGIRIDRSPAGGADARSRDARDPVRPARRPRRDGRGTPAGHRGRACRRNDGDARPRAPRRRRRSRRPRRDAGGVRVGGVVLRVPPLPRARSRRGRGGRRRPLRGRRSPDLDRRTEERVEARDRRDASRDGRAPPLRRLDARRSGGRPVLGRSRRDRRLVPRAPRAHREGRGRRARRGRPGGRAAARRSFEAALPAGRLHTHRLSARPRRVGDAGGWRRSPRRSRGRRPRDRRGLPGPRAGDLVAGRLLAAGGADAGAEKAILDGFRSRETAP